MNNGMKVLWLASIGVAFFLGYSVRSTTTNINEHNTSALIELPKQKQSGNQTEESNQSAQAIKIEKTNPTVKPELNNLLSDLRALLGGGHISMDMAATAQAYGLIENLTADELLEALSLMKGKLHKANNIQLLPLLIGRLAIFDPIKAVSFIEDNINAPQAKMTSMMSVLSSWVKEDPLSAYDWYINPSNGYTSGGMMQSVGHLTIFNGLAMSDANDAFAKLVELESSGGNTLMATIGFSQALENKEDFIKFIELSEQLDNFTVRENIVSSWVQKQPLETVEWLESIEDLEQQKKLKSAVFTTWSSAEPENAADWYVGQASENEKQFYAAKVVNNWAMRDPNEALNWLEQQTTFDTQTSTVKLLSSSTFSNPNFAVDNLELLSNDKDKTSVSLDIYRALERSSTNKAADFLASSPYKNEIEIKLERIGNHNKEKRIVIK